MVTRRIVIVFLAAFLFLAAVFVAPPPSRAASCCGGGSASFLVLPKLADWELSLKAGWEHYDGYWDVNGTWRPDPPDSDLNQYRLIAGAAYRLADNWQIAGSIPYVFNENRYSGADSSFNDFGDMTVGVRYETFKYVMCLTDIQNWRDLIPAVYLGMGLTIPTGSSPHDDISNSFDITGRGSYALFWNVLMEKTVYPWNLGVDFTYAVHLERDVNTEYGNPVEPFTKKLGDRFGTNVRFGAGIGLPWDGYMLTPTANYSFLWEDQAEIDGVEDPTSGLKKNAFGLDFALSNFTNEWITLFSWSHAVQEDGWGRNFPTTDTFTVGVTYVFYPDN